MREGSVRWALAASALSLVAGHAHAQDTPVKTESSEPEAKPNDKGTIADIVVTARRRNESLISVPVAVTALAAQDVDRYAATTIDKIAQLAPQVSISRGFSGNGGSFVIRGIGSSFFDAGIEQTVAINIDGVQISRGRIATAGQFDLQQVEILKGPQALFFGKNSPAGVISVTSADPGNALNGYARAGYEIKDREKYGEAAIGGPLSDTIGARIAIRGSSSDGYLHNVARPTANPAPGLSAFPFPGAPHSRVGGADELAVRGTLTFKPTSSLDVTAKAIYDVYKDYDFGGAQQNFCAPGVKPAVFGIVDQQDDCVFNNTTAFTAAPAGYLVNYPYARSEPYIHQKNVLASLTANYRFSNMTLTSVTGYSYIDTTGFLTSIPSSIAQIYNANPERTRTFTQEARLSSDFSSPFNFLFGAYYEHSNRRSQGLSRIAATGADPSTGRFFTAHRIGDIIGDTYSAFGQLRYKVASTLEATGGVRYTREDKDASIQNVYVAALFQGTTPTSFRAPGDPLLSSLSNDNWSPEFTLSWRPSTDLTVYGAYKSGFKSGGFSNPGTLRNFYTADTIRFNPEKARGGEVGVKGYLLDRKFRGDFTIYSYDFDGLQLSSFDAATISYQIKNAAKARTRGAELSLEWRATPELGFRGAVGYNTARYLSFPNATCYARQTTVGTGCSAIAGTTTLSQNLSGAPLARAPDWSLSGGASYTHEINDRLEFSLSADANYTSSYFTIEDNDPFATQNGFWRVNASARIAQVPSGIEFAIIGRNLFDVLYKTIAIDAAGGAAGQYNGPTPRGREVSLQVTYKF